MNELKPCPVCGGEAKFLIKAFGSSGITRGWEFGIYCTNCNITTPKTSYKLEIELNNNCVIVPTLDEREEAIKAWNRRVDNVKL